MTEPTKDQAIALPKLPNSVYQSGHAALYDGFQMHQYALRYAEQAQPPAPDCRTCESFARDDDHPQCKLWDGCTNGDQYQPAPQVVLWRTE